MVDRTQLFDILKRQKKAVLLDLLERSFDEMEPKQQRVVFGEMTKKPPIRQGQGGDVAGRGGGIQARLPGGGLLRSPS